MGLSASEQVALYRKVVASGGNTCRETPKLRSARQQVAAFLAGEKANFSGLATSTTTTTTTTTSTTTATTAAAAAAAAAATNTTVNATLTVPATHYASRLVALISAGGLGSRPSDIGSTATSKDTTKKPQPFLTLKDVSTSCNGGGGGGGGGDSSSRRSNQNNIVTVTGLLPVLLALGGDDTAGVTDLDAAPAIAARVREYCSLADRLAAAKGQYEAFVILQTIDAALVGSVSVCGGGGLGGVGGGTEGECVATPGRGGLGLTLADYALWAASAAFIPAMDHDHRRQIPNVCRWYDHVQQTPHLGAKHVTICLNNAV